MKVANGSIEINFYDDVLNSMSAEQKRELASLLIWDDDIMEDFVHQLTSTLATPNFYANIHKARLQLKSELPEMAQQLVAGLIEEAERATAIEHRMDQWAWLLYRYIIDRPNEFRGRLPEIPDWQSPKWDEIRKLAAERLATLEAQKASQ